jgi:hypothetical protein
MIVIFGLTGFIAESLASQCIDCHNNPKKLIQITREIAKTRPVKESKSEGKG